MHYRV